MDNVELRKLVNDENIENLTLGDLVNLLVSCVVTQNNLHMRQASGKTLSPDDCADLEAMKTAKMKLYEELNRREEQYKGGSQDG